MDGRLSPEFGGVSDFEYSDYPVDRDIKSRLGGYPTAGPSYYIDSYGRPIDDYNDEYNDDYNTLDI